MPRHELDDLYRRFGPLFYSHYRRYLRDDQRALEATRLSFGELVRRRITEAKQAVSFIRSETRRKAVEVDKNAAIYFSVS